MSIAGRYRKSNLPDRYLLPSTLPSDGLAPCHSAASPDVDWLQIQARRSVVHRTVQGHTRRKRCSLTRCGRLPSGYRSCSIAELNKGCSTGRMRPASLLASALLSLRHYGISGNCVVHMTGGQGYRQLVESRRDDHADGRPALYRISFQTSEVASTGYGHQSWRRLNKTRGNRRRA